MEKIDDSMIFRRLKAKSKFLDAQKHIRRIEIRNQRMKSIIKIINHNVV